MGIDDELVREFQVAGVTSNEVSAWIHAGGDEYLLLLWRDSEFSEREAAWWREINVSHPSTAREWIELGLPLMDVAHLAQSWILPEEWPVWREAGFSPTDAATWRDLPSLFLAWGQYDPDDDLSIDVGHVAEWRSAGFSAEDAAALVTEELTLDEAKRWRSAGFSIRATVEQFSDGLDTAIAERERLEQRRLHHLAVASGKPEAYEHAHPTMLCKDGFHAECKDWRRCACSCHCWHARRPTDPTQQVRHAGTNPPRFFVGIERTKGCREKRHEVCSSPGRCRCWCHCLHHD